MAKANILFVTSASRIAGAERVLLFILKNLNKNSFSSTVLLPEEGMLFDELKKMDVKIIKLKLIKRLSLLKMTFRIGRFRFYNPLAIMINTMFISFYFLSSIVAISVILKRLKIHILHVNSIDIAVRSFLAAASVKKPIVFHAHAILKPYIDNLFLRWLIDVPFRTICVSNAARRSVLRWSKDIDRIKTIYNTVDLSLFDGQFDMAQVKELKKSLNLSNLVVGMVGRFDPSKGHETFLEAASIVIDTVKDVSFLVVCWWALDFERGREESLKRYAKDLRLQGKVVFTGFIADVKKYYHLMDIVAVPSWEEHFALVPMEAMACRRPVIGTNTGGTPELIKDEVTGLLVPPRNPQALAKAITRLLKDEDLRKRLSLEGRRIVEEFFNGSRFIRDIEGVYKETRQRRHYINK